jgi:hypothetical protein
VGTAHLQQLVLTRVALRTDLAEPRGDHHERAYPLLTALACHIDHARRRHGDERELDRARDVADRRVRRNPLNDRGAGVHGVDDAGERLDHEVTEQTTADRLGVAGRTDHGAR